MNTDTNKLARELLATELDAISFPAMAAEIRDESGYNTCGAAMVRAVAAALRTTLAGAGVPEDWRVVPVIPTRQMCEAGNELRGEPVDSIYDAMIHTTPEQRAVPAEQQGAGDAVYAALERLVRESVHPYDGGEFEDGEWEALDVARAALAANRPEVQ